MRIIKAFEPLNNLQNAIYLDGSNKEDSQWRTYFINILEAIGFKKDIIDPSFFSNSTEELNKFLNWKNEAIYKASTIVIWIDQNIDEVSLYYTLGQWKNSDSIVVGYEKNIHGNIPLIDFICEKENIPVYYSMFDTAQYCIKKLIKPGQMFFTSDTHFSAERTLELSYRPFKSVEEMNLNLISNWNKKITMNDSVFHLGDFGNPDIVSCLNFKALFFIPGNYERKDKSIIEKLKQDKRVRIIDSMPININGKKYYLCHEPINNKSNSYFFLYGHIHRLQLVKRNGINVGIDGNRFYPMSTEEIEFLRGGIENHFDENVFCQECGK